MGKFLDVRGVSLIDDKVILGFSGGPDATALAYQLKRSGACVIPVYINYRKVSGGGKTAKDLHSAYASAKLLNIPVPIEYRAPLGARPKSQRNRFFVEVLASLVGKYCAKYVALGTIRTTVNMHKDSWRARTNDLNPEILYNHSKKYEVEIITWDSFGARKKADEFIAFNEETRKALFVTTSCQMWFHTECGNCASCISRHSAFMEAFGCDPTNYRPNSKVMQALTI